MPAKKSFRGAYYLQVRVRVRVRVRVMFMFMVRVRWQRGIIPAGL